MKIEVSNGELADKYSILCLKLDEIKDLTKKEHILYEKNLLHPYVMSIIEDWFLYYKLLHHVNRQIWDKTNEMKQLNATTEPTRFAKIASDIFQYNDKRFRMKRIFNLQSQVKEQKSYANKTLSIFIPDEYALVNKLDELIYLVLEYDHLYVKCNIHHFDFLSKFIPPCSLSYRKDCDDSVLFIDTITISNQNEVFNIIHHFTKLHAC